MGLGFMLHNYNILVLEEQGCSIGENGGCGKQHAQFYCGSKLQLVNKFGMLKQPYALHTVQYLLLHPDRKQVKRV